MRAALLAAAVMCAAGCGKREEAGGGSDAPDVPSAKGGIPDGWNHKDLHAHLIKKGVKVKTLPTVLGTADGPAVFFTSGKASFKDDLSTIDAFEKGEPDLVYSRLHKSAQAAKDSAGTKESAFTAGRFLFAGKGALYNQIKSALE
jgi:hypothetical protein